MSSRLRIVLLGPPHAEADGARIEVDTRKATALLAYLAVTEHAHHRDGLAELLWPGYERERSRAALRRTLSTLKAALPEHSLEVSRDSIGLRLDDPRVQVDVLAFRRMLQELTGHGHPANEVCSTCFGPLSRALELYGGDFMAGFGLRDSADFDLWQERQAGILRQELAGLLERLARVRAARGELGPAVELARRRLALDPLHEPAHRELMRLYARHGQRAAALSQYRECVRVLERELGVAPVRDTSALYELLLEGAALPPEPALADPSTGRSETVSAGRPPRGRLPLVGRSAELQRLLEAHAAAGRDGRLVVIEGEAGIGKTRLGEALLDHVRGAGGVGLAGRSYEGEGDLAYGPWVESLRAAMGLASREWHAGLSAAALAEVARLVPEVAGLRPALPPPAALDAPGARAHFFDGVGDMLAAACAGKVPGALLLDDLHWADDASLDLLAYLVRRLRRRPLLVVATWRTEEVAPGHRLRRLVAEVEREGAAAVVLPGRLSSAHVEELVRVVAPTPDPRLAQRLHAETDGLPFFVAEYLTSMTSFARVAEGDVALPMPGGVEVVLLARLGVLTETAAQVLGAAAVIGPRFDLEILQPASGRSEEETVAALEDLLSHALIQEQDSPERRSPSYRFRHELVRDLVYGRMSLGRRRLLHRRVADALAGLPQRDRTAAAGVIADQYRLAGRDAEAAHFFELAGEHAGTLFAHAEAVEHFRAAIAHGHPAALRLHEAVGDVLTLVGDYAGALTSYDTAAAHGGAADHARLEGKLGAVHGRRGAWDLAESHLVAALAALGHEDEAAERARLTAERSLVAHHRGDGARAGRLAAEALELARAAQDVQASAQAENILGVLAGGHGDPTAARRHLERSLELAERLGDPGAQVAALNNLALARAAGGDIEAALELATRALALGERHDRHREAALHNNLADLLRAAGEEGTAMAHLERAVTLFAEIGRRDGDHQAEVWKLTES